MNRRTAITMLTAALTTIAIAGCSTPAPSATSAPDAAPTAASSGATAQHNDADIAFVQRMIPHHSQAIAMAQLAPGRASSPKVTALATQIEKAQDPEIAQMQGFLQSWNVTAAPTGDMAGMTGMAGGGSAMGGMTGTPGSGSGMTGSGSGMTGMMSDQQMQQLKSANGKTFDRLFLQMMTEHHTGAIAMAKTELQDGQNPEAKALAQKIIDAQQAEITTMKQLLTAS